MSMEHKEEDKEKITEKKKKFESYLRKYQISVFIVKLSEEKCKNNRISLIDFESNTEKQKFILKKLLFNYEKDNDLKFFMPHFPYRAEKFFIEMKQNTEYFQYVVVNEIFIFLEDYLQFLDCICIQEVNNANAIIELLMTYYILHQIFVSIELEKYEKNIDYKIINVFKLSSKVFYHLNKFLKLLHEKENKEDIVFNFNAKNDFTKKIYEETMNFLFDLNNLRKNNSDLYVLRNKNKPKKEKNMLIYFIVNQIYTINDIKECPLHNLLLKYFLKIIKLEIFSNLKNKFKEKILITCNYKKTNNESSTILNSLMSYPNDELYMNWYTYQKLSKALNKQYKEIDTNLKSKITKNLKFLPQLFTEEQPISVKSHELYQKQINLTNSKEQFSHKYFYKSAIQVTKLKSQLIEFLKNAFKVKSNFYFLLLLNKISKKACSSILISDFIKSSENFNPSIFMQILYENYKLKELNVEFSTNDLLSKSFTFFDEKIINKILQNYAKIPFELPKIKEIKFSECEKNSLVALNLRASYFSLNKMKISAILVKKKHKQVLKHFFETFADFKFLKNKNIPKIELKKSKFIFSSKVEKENFLGVKINYLKLDFNIFLKEFMHSIIFSFRRIMSTITCPSDGNDVNYILETFGEFFAQKILLCFFKFQQCVVCEVDEFQNEENSFYGLLKSACYVISYSFITLNMDFHSPFTRSKKGKKNIKQFIQMMESVECIIDMHKYMENYVSCEFMKKFISAIFSHQFYQIIYESIKQNEIKTIEIKENYAEIFLIEKKLKGIRKLHKVCFVCLKNLAFDMIFEENEICFKIFETGDAKVCNSCIKKILTIFVHEFYNGKPKNTNLFLENFSFVGNLSNIFVFLREFYKTNSANKILNSQNIFYIFKKLEEEAGIDEGFKEFLLLSVLHHSNCLIGINYIEKNIKQILEIMEEFSNSEKEENFLSKSLFILNYINEKNLQQILTYFVNICEKKKEQEFKRLFAYSLEYFLKSKTYQIFDFLLLFSKYYAHNKTIQHEKTKILSAQKDFQLYSICIAELKKEEDFSNYFQFLENLPIFLKDFSFKRFEENNLLLFLHSKLNNQNFLDKKNIQGYQFFTKYCYESIFNNENELFNEFCFVHSIFNVAINFENSNKENKDFLVRILKQQLFYGSLLTKNEEVINLFLRYLFVFEKSTEKIKKSLVLMHNWKVVVKNILKYNFDIKFCIKNDQFMHEKSENIFSNFISDSAEKLNLSFLQNNTNNLEIFDFIKKIYAEFNTEDNTFDLKDFELLIERGPVKKFESKNEEIINL